MHYEHLIATLHPAGPAGALRLTQPTADHTAMCDPCDAGDMLGVRVCALCNNCWRNNCQQGSCCSCCYVIVHCNAKGRAQSILQLSALSPDLQDMLLLYTARYFLLPTDLKHATWTTAEASNGGKRGAG